MISRRHGSKPTLALWMLVAVADIAIIVVSTGLLTFLLVLVALGVIASGVVALRSMDRADTEPAKAVARRRA